MSRLIRCRRMGDNGIKAWRYAPCGVMAVALAAAFAVLAIGAVIGIAGLAGGRAAWAQDGPGIAPVCRPGVRAGSISPNGVQGRLEVGAHQLRLCGERGRLTYTMGGAPHVFEFASTLVTFPPSIIDNLNNWHDWYLYSDLCDVVPAASDLPEAKLTVRLISYVSTTDVSTTITLSPDTEKPTLNTTSTPRKGTKVKPGDTIKIRMEASEEYDATRKGWQTGVKKIQLIDEGPNPVVTPHFEATGGPRPCAEKQWKQTLEVTYAVPRNPPPIIRLRAIAEDFAGNRDDDIGEFPTGGWYGTFGWTHICVGGGNRDETRGISDLTLDYDGRGNLTGSLAGSTPERTQTIPPCSFRYVAPGTFSAKLVGSYTPGQDTFSAQAVEVRTTPGRASWTCPAGTTVTDQGFFTVYEGPMFRDAFRDLRRQPDGTRKSNGENTISAGGGTCTTTYSLTLRQAQN